MSIQSSIGPMAPQEPAKKEEVKKKLTPLEQEYEDGKNFLEAGDLAQAALSFHNVLLAHEESNDENGIANAVNQLGHVCMAKKEYEQARVQYRKAYDICSKNFDEMSLMALDRQFLAIHRALNEYDQAIEMCLDFVDIYQKNRDPDGTVLVLEEIADIYKDAGENKKAADTYRTVASIHQNYKHTNIAKDFVKKAEELEG